MVFQGHHVLRGRIHGFLGFTCFACQPCENTCENAQFALRAIHAGDDKYFR